MKVLYEDNHLLVVVKPPGLPTQGAAAGKPSLVDQAKQYIRQHYHKPGNVYLGVVSRLDRDVTGVVVFARTSKAASRLSEQFRLRRVEKVYWAVVEGLVPEEGQWVDWVAPNELRQRMQIVDPNFPGAQEAQLQFHRLASKGRRSLVEIALLTGRKHQIRLQAAARGFPIVGDRKYGPGGAWEGGIALHARRLVLAHPVGGRRLELEAELPRRWQSLQIDFPRA